MGTTFEEYPDGISNTPKFEKRCKNCKHYCAYTYEFDNNELDDNMVSDYGECRRFPPKVAPPEESGYPIVEEYMWCGEFDF